MVSKLVRDNIPSIIKQAGKKPIVRLANQKEMTFLLKEKLIEEATEVKNTYSQKTMKEEIADTLEVLISLAEKKHITWESIEAKRLQKAQKRGRFTKGYILEEIK